MLNQEQIQAALNKQPVTLRQAVANTTWFSRDGELLLSEMEESHLVNAAIHADKRSADIKALELSYTPLYHGKTWEDWATLFKAELEFRQVEPAPVAPSLPIAAEGGYTPFGYNPHLF
jgi:hypothetical protein